MEGGFLLYRGPWRICKGRLWKHASLSIGAPLGNLEWGFYTGDFERWMKEDSRNGTSLCKRALWREPGTRAPLLETPKDMLIKALEMGVCFYRVPCFGGTWREAPFLGPLREGIKFFIWENFYEEFRRYVKRLCKPATLCVGALLGNLQGVRFQGLLREKN